MFCIKINFNGNLFIKQPRKHFTCHERTEKLSGSFGWYVSISRPKRMVSFEGLGI